MIIDVHTHLWNPATVGRGFAAELVSGRVRDEPDSPYARPEVQREPEKYIMPVDWETFIKEMDEARIDRFVVLGFDTSHTWDSKPTPNDYVAEFQKKYPKRVIGFASVSPLDKWNRFNRQAISDLEVAIKELKLKGVKMIPTYDHYHPMDKAVYPVYEKIADLEVPILFHLSNTTFRNAPLSYASPMLIDQVGIDFPDLKIIIAHLGFPWTEEVFALMQKHPTFYTDMSAFHARPYTLCWNLTMAREYGVLDRVLFATDYPGTCRPAKLYVDFLKNKLNTVMDRTGLPTLTKDEIEGLLGKNAERMGLI